MVLGVGVVEDEDEEEDDVVFTVAVVVVLVYVGVCPSAARMYAPRRGPTVVDVILGVRLTAERFPFVAEKSC
jgi:VanZ family protein